MLRLATVAALATTTGDGGPESRAKHQNEGMVARRAANRRYYKSHGGAQQNRGPVRVHSPCCNGNPDKNKQHQKNRHQSYSRPMTEILLQHLPLRSQPQPPDRSPTRRAEPKLVLVNGWVLEADLTAHGAKQQVHRT
jgi:hypothetical protein